MIGRKRSKAALTIESSRRQAFVPLGLEREVDHQIAFFFTMPISSTMPISAMTDRS